MVFYLDAGRQKAIRDKVDFFVTGLPTFDAHVGLARIDLTLNLRLAELTHFFTVFSFNVALDKIRFAADWDAALAAAEKDFVLIQNCGHFFYGYDQLSGDLAGALNDCEFMMGHIMDRGGYFYMHDQCVLVNRRAWENLGRPSLGAPVAAEHEVALPYRSLENVHDNYTPLYLNPLGRDLKIKAQYGYGWNGISAGLRGGLRILNWPTSVRRWKHNCYAYYGDTAEWTKALANAPAAPPTEDKQLQTILQFLRNVPDAEGKAKHVFVFNSESDIDIPALTFRRGVDTAFLLAAGFKGNRVLNALRFHEGTHVVIYDYSAPALALRKMMIEEWDGWNFAAFLEGAKPRLQAMFDSQVLYLPPAIVADPAASDAEFQREIGEAFNRQSWLEHWRRYKALKHTFIEVDVVGDPAAVQTLLAPHVKGHCVIWSSDMYNSPNAVGKWDWAHRKASFDALAKTLIAGAESLLMIGGDPKPWLK